MPCSKLTNRIISIVEKVVYRRGGDLWECVGRAALANRIEERTSQHEELVFYMLGFPFKSKCAAKVLGFLPDLAEGAALRTLRLLLVELNEVYASGARYVIISDGVVFHDVYGVRNDLMLSYLLKMQEMCYEAHPKLECRSLYDFFPELVCGEKRCFDEAAICAKLYEVYQPSLDWVKAQRKRDRSFAKKGNDFQKFLYEDSSEGDFVSKNQRNKAAKAGSRKMLQRDEAIRLFMRDALRLEQSTNLLPSSRSPHSEPNPNKNSGPIRFSIRPRSQAGPTYCISLIPDQAAQREMAARAPGKVVELTTPWHNVAVQLAEGGDADSGSVGGHSKKRTSSVEPVHPAVCFMRRQHVRCFRAAKPVRDKEGRVCGFAMPRTLPTDPAPPLGADHDAHTDADIANSGRETGGSNCQDELGEERELELPPYPSAQEAQARRRQAVTNAARFGWSVDITHALRMHGDRILRKQVTRGMVSFGAGIGSSSESSSREISNCQSSNSDDNSRNAKGAGAAEMALSPRWASRG